MHVDKGRKVSAERWCLLVIVQQLISVHHGNAPCLGGFSLLRTCGDVCDYFIIIKVDIK
jgi:hypothetical protein